MSVDLKGYLLVGKVAKPHGIKGEIKIYCSCGLGAKDFSKKEIALKSTTGSSLYLIEKARQQNKYIIATLSDINNRNESELLVGSEIWLKESAVPSLGEDEFYDFQYVGLKVLTDDSKELGSVETVFPTGANDVLVVTGKGQEYLIPIIDDVILKVDVEAGEIIISPLPGLLEMNS